VGGWVDRDLGLDKLYRIRQSDGNCLSLIRRFRDRAGSNTIQISPIAFLSPNVACAYCALTNTCRTLSTRWVPLPPSPSHERFLSTRLFQWPPHTTRRERWDRHLPLVLDIPSNWISLNPWHPRGEWTKRRRSSET